MHEFDYADNWGFSSFAFVLNLCVYLDLTCLRFDIFNRISLISIFTFGKDILMNSLGLAYILYFTSNTWMAWRQYEGLCELTDFLSMFSPYNKPYNNKP